MRISIAGLTVGLVTLAASILPSKAADMPGRGPGSAKDYGQAGIPVPAPVPYEEHYKWYVSGGIGYAMRSGDGVTANHSIASHAFEDLNGFGVVSLAMGRYVTPEIRLELGLDFRMRQKVVNGTTSYTANASAPGAYVLVGPNNVRSTDYATYDVSHNENSQFNNHTLMANIYREFNREGAFRPYVGAGVGISMNMLNRRMSQSGVCTTASNDLSAPIPSGANCGTGVLPAAYATEQDTSTSSWGIAAALMAGMTYDLTKRTHLDIGYRAIWTGGTTLISIDTGSGISTVEVGSRFDHEIKTALRYDLW
jgi:opacity protein-like surface antigen